MADHGYVLADIDTTIRAFDRSRCDLSTINEFKRLVAERRLLIPGWVRQAVLGFVRSESHFRRLAGALAIFPDLPVRSIDHILAARRHLQFRVAGAQVQHYLSWVLAERIDGAIWSHDPRWQRLASHGCPLWTPEQTQSTGA